MAQKWYTKASVQTAIVVGIFGVVTAIVAGIFSLHDNSSNNQQIKQSSVASVDTIFNYKNLGDLENRIKRLEEIYGIYGDREKKVVVLIGRESASHVEIPLALEDIAISLRLAKLHERSSFGCYFEEGKDGLKVHFNGGVENTHLGFVLFKADLALKEYSIGTRLNGEVINSSVRIYPDILRQLNASSQTNDVAYARMWLANHTELIKGNHFVRIKSGIFARAEEFVVKDGNFVALDNNPNSSFQTFAKFFTDQYYNIAKEEPYLAAFARIAQIFAVSKWIIDNNLSEDISWLDEYVNRQEVKTPIRIPKFNITHEKIQAIGQERVVSSSLKISGGVSIEVLYTLIQREVDEKAIELENRIEENIELLKRGTVLELNLLGQKYVGMVLSSL